MTDPLAAQSEPADIVHGERTARTARLVDQLLAIVTELEAMHPGRKFPLDGHLVGSIGEAAAEALFDIRLVAASSSGHDARAKDNRRVEIKATYGTRGVGIRKTSHTKADALIVLQLSRFPLAKHEVVFNGSLAVAWQAAGAVQSNGQAWVSLTRLRELNKTVMATDRIPLRPEPMS